MIRIAVCDDEAILTAYFKEEIGKAFAAATPALVEIDAYTSPLELLKNLKYDLIFLDIDMPEMDGFETAQKIADKDRNAVVVFISSHEHLVYKSFKYHPFSFVRKDYFESSITEVAGALVNEIFDRRAEIILPTGEAVPYIDIAYIEVEDKMVAIHSLDGASTVYRCSLQVLENDLLQNGFVKVSKSAIVNLRYIMGAIDKQVTLKNNETVTVSRRLIHSVRERFAEYITEQLRKG